MAGEDNETLTIEAKSEQPAALSGASLSLIAATPAKPQLWSQTVSTSPIGAVRAVLSKRARIEQAIELLKARKAALAEALFEGSAKTLSDLTEADVSALFAPLSIAKRATRKAA